MNTAVSVFPVHCKKEMGKYDKLGKVAFNGEWSVESKERNKIEKKRSANDTRNQFWPVFGVLKFLGFKPDQYYSQGLLLFLLQSRRNCSQVPNHKTAHLLSPFDGLKWESLKVEREKKNNYIHDRWML